MHANGEVQAKVWYEQKEKIELNQVISRKTEKSETRYSLRINNFTINFYKTLSKFKKYDTIEEVKKLKLFSEVYLPVEIIQKKNYELEDNELKLTLEEAKQKAVEAAKAKIEEQVINKENILNTYINYNETEDYAEAQVIYEVLEDIGTKEKIVF